MRSTIPLQETFNTVANHLMKQGQKSILIHTMCAYRGPGELRCAAGCLIPDDVYSPEMERCDWFELWETKPEVRALGHNVDLVGALQSVHDDNEPKDWPVLLRKMAESQGFSLPPCLQQDLTASK